MTRLFVAIDFSAEIKSYLSYMCCGFRDVKWTARENFHLTLSFLGDIYPENYLKIRSCLDEIEFSSFELEFRRADILKSGKIPHVLVIDFKENESLMELQQSIEKSLRGMGLSLEKRNFKPHVTLARFGGRPPGNEPLARYLESHAWIEAPPIEVKSFHLFSSKLHPDGARYQIEESYSALGELHRAS